VRMSVEVATLRAQPAVAVRSVVPMSDLDVRELFGAALGRLFPYLGEHGLAPAGAPYARYAEFGPERADVEIGVPLAADGALGLTVLPGGEVATYLHVGPYPDHVQAYQAIESWLAESGRSAGGAPWEVYEVGPDKVDDDPARLETLVCWPLA
jgi:effector-binding domain-containing protein